MKKLFNYIFSISLFLLSSCSPSQDPGRDQIPDSTTSPTKNIDTKFEETHVLKAGDSIVVFGGTQGFLSKQFGADTCIAKVLEIYFSKEVGQIALIDFQLDSIKSKSYSLNLWYWDSSRGYELSSLRLWDEIFTEDHRDSFGPLIGSDFVDHAMGFNIKN